MRNGKQHGRTGALDGFYFVTKPRHPHLSTQDSAKILISQIGNHADSARQTATPEPLHNSFRNGRMPANELGFRLDIDRKKGTIQRRVIITCKLPCCLNKLTKHFRGLKVEGALCTGRWTFLGRQASRTHHPSLATVAPMICGAEWL